MAITKPPVLPAWAESGDKVTPSNAEIQVGWPLSSIPPSRQRFNWLLNFLANGIRYFSRRGLPDYDAAETYMTGDRIIGDNGKTYRSLIDNNTAQTPSTSPTKWEEWAPTLSRFAALIQGQTYTAFTTAGAAPNFTLTPSPAISAYAAGQRFRVKFHAAGTGADVLNVSALGNKSLKQYDSTGAKVAAVIAANQLVDVEYDGADMVLLDPLPVDFSQVATALPYPTVASSDLCLTVTGAIVAGTGGTVSIAAGTAFTLAEAVSASLARMRNLVTTNWTSANLSANTTYYLRAQIIAGALTFYVQGGTDSDAIPGNFVGTPNAGTGGGFDSTTLDMLIAKVVTGANGTTPTITKLANRYLLTFSSIYTPTLTADGLGIFSLTYSSNINWARTPKVTASLGYDITNITTASALDRCYISAQTVSRYTLSWTGYYDIFTSVAGSVVGQLNAFGVA